MNRYCIILPVRNGGQYLKLCVDSILSQTFPEFNLVVLDNCSTDGSGNWIESIKDDRIRMFPSLRPLTIEENWGRIKDIPKNEFITLIGHDDILRPNYLETMDLLISKHPGASLYQTHFSYIDGQGKEIRKCLPMDETQTAPEFLSAILASTVDIMGTGFMMRAKDYDSIGGIPGYPNLLFADFALWMQLTMKSYKATSFEESFAFRRHLSTTAISPDIKMQQAFGLFIDYLERLGATDEKCAAVIQRYSINFISKNCRGLAHRLLRTPKSRRENISVAILLKECKKYAERLHQSTDYDPVSDYTVRLAALIDSNLVTRELFLLFKKIYSKPVLR